MNYASLFFAGIIDRLLSSLLCYNKNEKGIRTGEIEYGNGIERGIQ